MDTGKPGNQSFGRHSATNKNTNATRDKIRNVLGKASTNIGLGKLPPQAVDLEEAVLGALMLEKDALTTVIDILKPDSFYKETHQLIYEAILQLFDNSEPVDLLTVTNRLRKNANLEKVGGAFYISGLTQRVNSAANIEFHARIISEQAIKRELISIASEIETEAYEDTTDTFMLLDKMEQRIFGVSEANIRKNYADMRSIMRDAITDLESKKLRKDGLTGVPTGFSALDRLTSGWQKSDLVIIAARPGMGKCLGKGTKVLMFDGLLKKVEDVHAGDLLMGDDSTPRKVLSIARGRERMYWVRQNKGMDYRVNESHILSLKRSRSEYCRSEYCRSEYCHKNGDVLNISVKDYLIKSDKFKSNYKGYKVAVDFPEKDLPIDPYFVGLWLGDGDTNSARITNEDAEVLNALKIYADELCEKGHLATVSTYAYEGKCTQWGGPPHAITKGFRGGGRHFSLKEELRRINLLGAKHIPQDYLINSTDNRLHLLAGLIDSDGHYLVQSNGYEITQSKKQLAFQIKFLCDSLGFRASIRKKRASISSIGYESEVYRIRFYGDVDRIPVRIERKKAKPWNSKVNWQVTGIQVEYDKVDDYFGFEIDGNRLFLLEDMTVTHNTAFILSAMRNAAVDFGHSVAIFSLEMSSVQLANRLISAEAQLESEKIKKGNLADYEWEQLYHKTTGLTEASIFIDDTPALSIRELRSKCRRLKAQHNIELIVVDYLQLMSGDSTKNNGGNREQEIASISRAMKNLAKELEVPVVALSQLSRAVESRGGDKRPQLSDLRESGCLTGDTLIFNALTGENMPIAELVKKKEKAEAHGEDSCFRDFNVSAIDEQLKLSSYGISNAFYSGKKEAFEITTRTGRKIKASANHPFLKLQGWTRLDQLAVGDKIAVPRKLKVTSPTNIMSSEELILLAHLLGDGCVIPNAVFQCDEEHIALFLNHLWATDGNISWKTSKNRHQSAAIYYGTTSTILARQVQHLLLRLGIQSFVKESCPEKYRRLYYVHIYGRDQQLAFLKKVGCHGERGSIIPEMISVLETIATNPNYDIIPKEAWVQMITQYKNLSRLSWRQFALGMDMQYCGSTLYQSGISRSRMQQIYKILPFAQLKYLAESDVLWDEIVSIQPLGIQDVYDITVDDVHNFVANDIITHNSIEQDADMVMFLYRPEYYGFSEDESGQPVQGTGEVIIAKHRNGALDTIRLKFIGKFTKFTNLDGDTFDPGYGNQLVSSSMPNEFNDSSNIVTFGSKANNPNFKQDKEEGDSPQGPKPEDEAPF